MNSLIEQHRSLHPAMEPQDEVKLVFQAMVGCGHLLADEATVARRIAQEESALQADASAPLVEPIGDRFLRVNLGAAMAAGITPTQIARMMIQSASKPVPSREDVSAALARLGYTDAAQHLTQEPGWLPNHSQAYHQAYAPAYRVVGSQWRQALEVLRALHALPEKERMLMCIDGPCGSGKSSLAHQLQLLTDAAVVPMDDFFLPHPRKTPERLAQPGGNADWERLVEEFLQPWRQHGRAAYRPYRCGEQTFSAPVEVPPRKLTIIEGSYSLMPEIARHADLRVFLTIDAARQQERILRRNGEDMLRMFQTRWIPLEQAYFDAMALPDAACLTLAPQPEVDV